jgi:glycosyltransferase involved in cell wall biosynthesis
MRLLITTEYRFQRDESGKIVAAYDGGYSFWKQYLDVFDSVQVIGRVLLDQTAPTNLYEDAEGENVSIFPLPGYRGPGEYLRHFPQLRRAVKQACKEPQAVLLRAPGAVANLVWREIRQTRQPYGVEVIGDPYQVFALGATHHPLRPYFRWLFTSNLQQQCQEAAGVAYVTESNLQRRYPHSNGTVTASYSSVGLPIDAYVDQVKLKPDPSSFTVIGVGSLAQPYKGVDVLIKAIKQCIDWGLNIRLIWVGDGKYRSEYQTMVNRLGLTERINLIGQLPHGEAVRTQLDLADLFVLPSRTEGLPRAMIEAMARGLPCIGSNVGGIPELLRDEDMVPSDDSGALAQKIAEVFSDPQRMVEMARHNLTKAQQYRDSVLRERRIAFYRHIGEKTEQWLRTSR